MSEAPLVSILMNCYNGEKYLKEAIDSVYSQTYKDWEIIFIDNCSTDDTKNIIDTYDEKIKYYKTEKNILLGAARNWGLQFVNTEYIAFLDTDDIWMPKKLEIQISKMNKNKAWMSFTSSHHINSIGKIIDTKILNDDDTKLCSQFKNYTISMQTVVINLEKFDVVFDEKLSYAPDFKLFMSVLAESNGNVNAEKDILTKYRVHGDSLSNKSINVKYIEVKSILKYLKDSYPNQVASCNNEFEYALLLAKSNKAEYLMSIGKFQEAASVFFLLRNIKKSFLIKSFIFRIPIVNKLFYQYLLQQTINKLK